MITITDYHVGELFVGKKKTKILTNKHNFVVEMKVDE